MSETGNHENYFGVIGKEGENSITPNGEMLLDFCIRNNLKIANTFFMHKNIHKWTRVSEDRNEKSIIDYIIISNNLFYNTNDVRVKRGAEIYSDHFLVSGKFNLEIQFTCKAKEAKHFKLKVENLKTKENKVMYQNLIDRKLREIEINENELRQMETDSISEERQAQVITITTDNTRGRLNQSVS